MAPREEDDEQVPRPPHFGSVVAPLTAAVYTSVAARLKGYAGELYPLHVGDTWMEPAPGCRMEDLRVLDHPGMHRYTAPRGLAELREAIAGHTTEVSGEATNTDEVLIAAGATAALSVLVAAVVDPGDEVLVMAPYWPLIAGAVRMARGEVVQVPLFAGDDLPATAAPAAHAFRSRSSERTVAIYLNTPHNPSGRILPRAWAQAIVAWARDAGLWIFADEVYEPFVYHGEHVHLRPLAPERTITSHSFSKVYGMTGNRCGYLVGPADLLAECNKLGTHTYYCAPHASQLAALAALTSPAAAEWVAEARESYCTTGREAAAMLGVPAPEGSTFLFVDVEPRLDERGLVGFLEDCAEHGLLLAPGPSFGAYPHHVRLCFTSAAPELVLRGVEKLARELGR